MEEIFDYLKENSTIENIPYDKLNDTLFNLSNERYSVIDHKDIHRSLDILKNKEMNQLYTTVKAFGHVFAGTSEIICEVKDCTAVACYIGNYPGDLLVSKVKALDSENIELHGTDSDGIECVVDAKDVFVGQLSYLIEGIDFLFQTARRGNVINKN